jgi:hypothetical protein
MTFPKITEGDRLRRREQRRDTKSLSNAARAEVDRRSGGRCEIRIECFGAPAVHKHHRRRAGRMDTAANLLNTCLNCHSAVHANPSKSYRLGLLVSSWDQPEDVEITHERLSLVATDGPWS